MLIELRSLCPVRLWWHDSLECVATQARIISLKTEHQLLGWVIVNGLVGSDRAMVELVNPIAMDLPVWPNHIVDFATEEAAKFNILTRVRGRLCGDVRYRWWAAGSRGTSGWMPRLTNRMSEWVTVTETW